ncbi:hypothetical protein [Flavobacterium piscis]|uniref:Collagen-like protein n=1 Tax=Flavobacterium piscis TaxID=1114874 RepID=A0ABU1Y3C8_9FLAO|nr:hypothetical protein [Flavobacterium piscis]MDR7208732.1 hypothetical protein [Flavobacterium piscis]
MKTLFKSKLAFLLVLTGLAFSCKKNETAPADNYNSEIDSTEMAVDTIGPNVDTTNVNSGTTGTTGATGESSTGSGSAGTTQKGNPNVRADSTSSANRE